MCGLNKIRRRFNSFTPPPANPCPPVHRRDGPPGRLYKFSRFESYRVWLRPNGCTGLPSRKSLPVWQSRATGTNVEHDLSVARPSGRAQRANDYKDVSVAAPLLRTTNRQILGRLERNVSGIPGNAPRSGTRGLASARKMRAVPGSVLTPLLSRR